MRASRFTCALASALLAGCLSINEGKPGQCSEIACLEQFRIIVQQGVPSGVPPTSIEIKVCRNGSCFDPVVTPVSSTNELALANDLGYGAGFSRAGCGENGPKKPALCIVVYCSGTPPFPKVNGDEFDITVSDPHGTFEPTTFTGKIAYVPYAPPPCKNHELICQSGTLSFVDPALLDHD
jgi:hypothetical protein